MIFAGTAGPPFGSATPAVFLLRSGGTVNMEKVIVFLAIAATLGLSHAAIYQGRGEGGIVIRDEAPVYKKSTGDAIQLALKRGDAIAGVTMPPGGGAFGGEASYEFDERNGRVRILYLAPGKKLSRDGWIDPANLSRFTFDLSCGGAFSSAGNMQHRWNACFKEARDAKLAEMNAPAH